LSNSEIENDLSQKSFPYFVQLLNFMLLFFGNAVMRQGISNPRKIFNEGKVKEFGVLVKGKKYVQFS
jgi:hypothetical protein